MHKHKVQKYIDKIVFPGSLRRGLASHAPLPTNSNIVRLKQLYTTVLCNNLNALCCVIVVMLLS